MKLIKSSLLVALIGLSVSVNAAVVSGVITDNRDNGNVLVLTTNRASAYQFEVTATANTKIDFYDLDITNLPMYGTNKMFYTNLAYPTRITFPTNYVYSFVGYNGYTNWYTNQGIYTLSITNAASTNALTPLFSAVVAGNTYAVYNVDALFVRGITALVTSGTNVNVVVQYRSGQ